MVLNEMKGLMIVAELREPVARELKDGVTPAIVAGARGRLLAAWFDFSTWKVELIKVYCTYISDSGLESAVTRRAVENSYWAGPGTQSAPHAPKCGIRSMS